MSLSDLFGALADVCDGPHAIEGFAADMLRTTAGTASQSDLSHTGAGLPASVLEEMSRPDAHPVCALIARLPFSWAPPTTSNDPAYIAHSTRKVHVELLGPQGLVPSDQIRLGLYGMLPFADYGLRTHPAEEIFIMLAGTALWRRDDTAYTPHQPGDRSYHPSGLPHATRTLEHAFMSVYVWAGDISTDGYVYTGFPSD